MTRQLPLPIKVTDPHHADELELEAGLAHILRSPKNQGVVEMIVCRPAVDQRRVLEAGELDLEQGLVGDNWQHRGSSKTPDRSAHPEMQLNLMSSRVIDLVAGTKERWPLAGDQFLVDLDLSQENMPPGTQIEIGSALIEVTAMPHKGCKKFVARFGLDAMRFISSERGRRLNLRGINAKVVKPGIVRAGDSINKLG
ncbi:MAG: MOSC domain-containing protein [Acidobacteriota bacterium]